MEFNTMTRPSMPLSAACASPSLLPAPAAVPVAWEAVRSVAVLAAERAPVSPVHQVQVQAELAQALLLADETNGTISSTGTTSTNGFDGIDVAKKRYADGGSGVPPRGRPV